MEPHTSAARLRWLEHHVEGLAHEVTSVRAQFRALVLRPPQIGGADQELAELLQQQLATMEGPCALIRAQLAVLRADVTGEPLPDMSTAADTMTASAHESAADEPAAP